MKKDNLQPSEAHFQRGHEGALLEITDLHATINGKE